MRRKLGATGSYLAFRLRKTVAGLKSILSGWAHRHNLVRQRPVIRNLANRTRESGLHDSENLREGDVTSTTSNSILAVSRLVLCSSIPRLMRGNMVRRMLVT